MAEDTRWVEFALNRPKRSRAALACEACHSKKVKCDLQTRANHGHTACSRCAANNDVCQQRISKRDSTRKHVYRNRNGDHPTPSTNGHDARESTDSSQGTELAESHAQSVAVQQAPTPASADMMSSAGLPLPSGQMAHAPIDSRPTPSMAESTPSASSVRRYSSRYDVDPGFLHVYDLEHESDARSQALSRGKNAAPVEVPPDLRQSFYETYFEYCSAFCPVMDRASWSLDLERSPMLSDALALVGSHLRPPMLPGPGPSAYYDRARRRFYDDEETDLTKSLQAVSLFYWWSPKAPTTVHRHSSWWWTAVVIKHCQQAGVQSGQSSTREDIDGSPSLLRRIWWTAFARERLTAMCQGRPCIIELEDCYIPAVSLDDFPPEISGPEKLKAEVFVYWVRLCLIIGRIAQYLSRYSITEPTPPFPVHLATELANWVQSLPPHLQLPIGSLSTTNFNRDVHQMHLPYLAVIIVLYLKRSFQAKLPTVLPPAILAATCVARIVKDFLMRSEAKYLMAITCWYCGTAFVPLLHASTSAHLRLDADAELDTLAGAVDQMRTMYATGNVYHQGFQRLRKQFQLPDIDPNEPESTTWPSSTDAGDDTDGYRQHFNHMQLFPFLTSETSGVALKVLAQQSLDNMQFPSFGVDPMLSFQDLFQGLEGWMDPQFSFTSMAE